MEEVKRKESFIALIKKFKFFLLIIIFVAIIVYIFINFKTKGERRLLVRTQLEKVENISELSSTIYTYNSVATKYKDDSKKNIEYHVICYGEVTTGIDFDKIGIDIKGKKILLNVPELKIQSINVPIEKLNFIEVKKYNEEDNILQDAKDLCTEQIKEKLNEDAEFKDIARENVKLSIEGFLKPWIDSLNGEFKVEIK